MNMADDENPIPTVPNLELAQWRFLLVDQATPIAADEKAKVKAQVFQLIQTDCM